MGSVEPGMEVTACLDGIHFQWYLQKERGEGTAKSSSCPPSRRKPRHTLVMVWYPQAASSSLVLLPFIPHAWLCSHTCVCTPGRSAWASAACGTGILTYFPFPSKRRWKSFKKWFVPLNFKSLKIAPYWEFNSFLNVNSGKYLLFLLLSHITESVLFFSVHWIPGITHVKSQCGFQCQKM